MNKNKSGRLKPNKLKVRYKSSKFKLLEENSLFVNHLLFRRSLNKNYETRRWVILENSAELENRWKLRAVPLIIKFEKWKRSTNQVH